MLAWILLFEFELSVNLNLRLISLSSLDLNYYLNLLLGGFELISAATVPPAWGLSKLSGTNALPTIWALQDHANPVQNCTTRCETLLDSMHFCAPHTSGCLTINKGILGQDSWHSAKVYMRRSADWSRFLFLVCPADFQVFQLMSGGAHLCCTLDTGTVFFLQHMIVPRLVSHKFWELYSTE